jgi:uncharacterized protein DUF5615
MLRFLADEDFNGRIFRGLYLRKPKMELVRVQDVGLSGSDDRTILQWCVEQDCILLTHDARTIPKHASEHLAGGMRLPGVLIVDDLAPIGTCIEDLLLIADCSDKSDWQDQIYYLPF